MAQWKEALGEAAGVPTNRRRLTNLGTLWTYVQAIPDSRPQVHRELICMVCQLASEVRAIPLEVCRFTATVKWVEYEGIPADFFDHLFAVLPEF